EAARLPRRTGRDAGQGRDAVAERREALEERVGDRADGAKVVAAPGHVEGHAALVERDEEPAEAVVERIDVVEQPEVVRLAPGEDLPADAEVDRPLAEVDVAEEEAVPLARDAPQERDPLVDEPVWDGRRGQRRPGVRKAGEIEPQRPVDRELVAPLPRPVVVDALALAAVLEAVFERVRIEPAEGAGDAGPGGREALDVVVELQLEEVAVLADVAGSGAWKGQWIVR